MNCQQAQNLFDVYLDGELTGSIATEFAAHRLECAHCRRSLALMEVAAHVVATDPADSPGLDEEFTNRLLACVHANGPRRPWYRRRVFALGAPLAAAAALAFVLYGPFRYPGSLVRGVIEPGVQKPEVAPPPTDAIDPAEALKTMQDWVDDSQSHWFENLAPATPVGSAPVDATIPDVNPATDEVPVPDNAVSPDNANAEAAEAPPQPEDPAAVTPQPDAD